MARLGARAAASALLCLVTLAGRTLAGRTLVSESETANDVDRVTSLPGLDGPIGFGMHAGYVTVDKAKGRALYYILTEKATEPETAPLVLWLNGGPGCSSIGGGYMSELGAKSAATEIMIAWVGSLVVTKTNGKLVPPPALNPQAWNTAANILFLDSPAYVGFSFSNSSDDKVVGDARTAADARLFLLGFFKKFPQYATRPLYLTGESYAGHYIPNLAKAILDGNSLHKTDPKINLQGIMVGNPWTDAQVDNAGAAFMWWTHALIATPTFDTLKKTCNMSEIGPIRCAASVSQQATSDSTSSSSDADECEAALESAMDEMGNINIYQVYADVCEPREARFLARSIRSAGAQQKVATFGARALLKRSEAAAKHFGDAPATSTDDSGFPSEDACVDEEVEKWLNRDDVQTALNTMKLPFHICTDDIQYSGADVVTSMLPVYDALLDAGLRIMIYSGDVDGIVPTTGTRMWVEGLGLPVRVPWTPWLSPGPGQLPPQVGGYVTEYDGLMFATVRGAGHMVPYVQPERSLLLFNAFLSNKSPAASSNNVPAAAVVPETGMRDEVQQLATATVGALERAAERVFKW